MPNRIPLLAMAALFVALPIDPSPTTPLMVRARAAQAMPQTRRPPPALAAAVAKTDPGAPAKAPCTACKRPKGKAGRVRPATAREGAADPHAAAAAPEPMQVNRLAYYWPTRSKTAAVVIYEGRVEGDDMRAPAVVLRTEHTVFETAPEWVFTLFDLGGRLVINLHNLPGTA